MICCLQAGDPGELVVFSQSPKASEPGVQIAKEDQCGSSAVRQEEPNSPFFFFIVL